MWRTRASSSSSKGKGDADLLTRYFKRVRASAREERQSLGVQQAQAAARMPGVSSRPPSPRQQQQADEERILLEEDRDARHHNSATKPTRSNRAATVLPLSPALSVSNPPRITREKLLALFAQFHYGPPARVGKAHRRGTDPEVLAADRRWRKALRLHASSTPDEVLSVIERLELRVLVDARHPLSALVRRFARLFVHTYRVYFIPVTGATATASDTIDSGTPGVRLLPVTRPMSSEESVSLLERCVLDVKRFVARLVRLMLKTFPELDNKIGRDCCTQAATEALLPKIVQMLMPFYKRRNFYRDAAFVNKLRSLKRVVTTEKLGVSKKFCLDQLAAMVNKRQRQEQQQQQQRQQKQQLTQTARSYSPTPLTRIRFSKLPATNARFQTVAFDAESGVSVMSSVVADPAHQQNGTLSQSPHAQSMMRSLINSLEAPLLPMHPKRHARANTSLASLPHQQGQLDLEQRLLARPHSLSVLPEMHALRDMAATNGDDDGDEEDDEEEEEEDRKMIVGFNASDGNHKKKKSAFVTPPRPVSSLTTSLLGKKMAQKQQQEVKDRQDRTRRRAARSFDPRDPFRLAVERLQSLSMCRTPKEKLKAIVDTSNEVCACVDKMYEHIGVPLESEVLIGADDLLSIFAFLVIQSEYPDTISEASFLEDFTSASLKLGPGGYSLATLRASIELLEDLPMPAADAETTVTVNGEG